MTLALLLLAAGCRTAPAPPAAQPVEPSVPDAAPVPAPLSTAGTFLHEPLPGLRVGAWDLSAVEGTFNRPDPAAVAGIDPRVFVVTVDPGRFDIVGLSALDPTNGIHRPADAWAGDHGLVVAWNPGMFEPDGKATGYARYGGFHAQDRVRRNAMYASFFHADPGSAGVTHLTPPSGEGTYGSRSELAPDVLADLDGRGLVAQSLTILRDGQRAYPPRKNHWSELAYGVDDQGRVAIVFTRVPLEMRELGARLEALDLGLRDLIHGEGGPEASLVVRTPTLELTLCGSYETGFWDDSNTRLWTLPAVMGARPR